MEGYKIIVKASRERFMEPDLMDTSEWFIACHSEEDAVDLITSRLHNGGWNIHSIRCNAIWIHELMTTEKKCDDCPLQDTDCDNCPYDVGGME